MLLRKQLQDGPTAEHCTLTVESRFDNKTSRADPTPPVVEEDPRTEPTPDMRNRGEDLVLRPVVAAQPVMQNTDVTDDADTELDVIPVVTEDPRQRSSPILVLSQDVRFPGGKHKTNAVASLVK